MICVGYPCDNCKNKGDGLIDGWKPWCKAYPDGIPYEVALYKKNDDFSECNNGYYYDPIKEKWPEI